MSRTAIIYVLMSFLIVILILSCSEVEQNDSHGVTWESVQDSTHRILKIGGLAGPEAVRYDPEQDVYFVSNFTGGGNDRDADGFISKVGTEGSIDSLRFMQGTEEAPLHAPRGLYITGETLWAADIDGVHGFNKATGKQTDFIDFRSFEPGFLNDIVRGSDGMLYVTDTGKPRLYRISDKEAELVRDSLSFPPNGVTAQPRSNNLILAPWGDNRTFLRWNTDKKAIGNYTVAESGGNFDGIEFIGSHLLAASQKDSSIHLLSPDTDKIVIQVPGRPADIGLDTKRMQLAVPYIALDRVDIWQLPTKGDEN